MKRLLALLILAASLSAHAEAPLPARTVSVFEQGFRSDQVYSPLACHQNIRHLVQELKRARVNLNAWRVVFLAPVRPADAGGLEISGEKLRPLRSRGGPVEWLYHVVATDGAWVLDFDLGEAPRVVAARDYLDAQFGPAQNAMGARAYPAEPYARLYSDVIPRDDRPLRNWAYYLYGIDGTRLTPACEAFGSCR